MIISNIYTTIAYVLHERLWSKISWGMDNFGNTIGCSKTRGLQLLSP